jgi:thiamine pyrophosphate-dependent acetolactate synthase large subunit-like protein
VTGFVTAVKTAYWNHTPLLLVTPQAANRTLGQGGLVLNQELGEPFRRDAMKAPVVVAGVDPADMRLQPAV